MSATKLKGKAIPAPLQKLYEKACTTRRNSYSPYSTYKVGAALRTSDGKIYTGCNVENSSYGATICAERTAVFKAVSESGNIEIDEIVVVTDELPPWPPCGMCRQVIGEFCSDQTRIHAANLKGDSVSWTFGDLLPAAFLPEHLKKKKK